MYDVAIIGGGITGCAIARELSRRERTICVIERESDVCEGTSKANSGIIHAGYDAAPGSLKAVFNVKGASMMEALSEKLSFPYRRNGSLVLCRQDQDENHLRSLLERGIANGVSDLRIIDREEIRRLEPNINEEVTKALYVPTGAVADPFLMTVAMAENAAVNGVEFLMEHEVKDISHDDRGYVITTAHPKGGSEIRAKYVINAAGVYADKIHHMVSDSPLSIRPVRGEYCLFDKEIGGLIRHTLFQLPDEKGKGVLVTPTVHGNLMAGPTASEAPDKGSTDTTASGLDYVLKTASMSVKNLPKNRIITSFAGLRAKEAGGDFIIGFAKDSDCFLDAAGIESPGLSAAPAIAEYIAELLLERDNAKEKNDFKEEREGIPCMASLSDEERDRLIREDPAYSNVICRCELVTEAEILQAIRRPVGARTLDGVKRRVRAGMGRCQGGFCSPKVLNILAGELGVDPAQIRKSGQDSNILTGENKRQQPGGGR